MKEAKTGVVLINLGTPLSCDVRSVRQYLKEFLDDPRVIDLPWWLRKPLLYCFILPFRPQQSAKAYQAIWDEQKGSPLLYQTLALKQEVKKQIGENYDVEVGMRYAKPSIEEAIEKLLQRGCEKLVFLPLFPHYSSAATGSAIQKALQIVLKKWHIPAISVHHDFYHDALYIQSLSEVIAPYLEQENYDKILFSYHSLPKRQIYKADSGCKQRCPHNTPCQAITAENKVCYRAKCYETSRLLAHRLAIAPSQYDVVFQSRLGRTEWIGPDLVATMTRLIDSNVRHLLVASPSFVTDCLETLEEIGMRAKEQWKLLGGERFTLVPSLNIQQTWVKAVISYVKA